MARMTLKAARVNAGYTQKEAAERLGVSNTTLCNWENGVSFPDVPYIEKICELYGLSYDDIIFLPSQSALNGLERNRHGIQVEEDH